jgi:hypothetical protein
MGMSVKRAVQIALGVILLALVAWLVWIAVWYEAP